MQKREHFQKSFFLFDRGKQLKHFCLFCNVKLSSGFPLNHFLILDEYQVHTHFKGMKKVLTIRFLAVNCFTVQHIR